MLGARRSAALFVRADALRSILVGLPWVVVIGAVATACATTPRPADGPHPSLAPDETVEPSGRASVSTVPQPPNAPVKAGPFCAEVVDRDHWGKTTGICADADDAGK
jgi:hypothetical protein